MTLCSFQASDSWFRSLGVLGCGSRLRVLVLGVEGSFRPEACESEDSFEQKSCFCVSTSSDRGGVQGSGFRL
jgi:hypothetical protein